VKVWEALVQSRVTRAPKKVRCRVRFNKIPEKVPVKVWEALVQSQVRFNRLPEKVPETVLVWRRFWELWCRATSGSTGFGEGSGEGLGGFGAEPGQVQQDLRPFNSRKPS